MHVTAYRPLRWALTMTPEAVGGAAWANDQRAALWRGRQYERLQGTCRIQLFRPVAGAVVASHSRHVVAGQQMYRYIAVGDLALLFGALHLQRRRRELRLVVRRALQTRMRLALRGRLALREPTMIITGDVRGQRFRDLASSG